MAMVNPRVTADVIEAGEFPDLARRYAVRGVPKTVVNDSVEILGGVPEDRYVREVLKAVPPTA
ncbi:MAG: thioredoxin family protein [Chloroflexi bacterium]|nr:thioredoxin family protein [Chloroflexota bacterium]